MWRETAIGARSEPSYQEVHAPLESREEASSQVCYRDLVRRPDLMGLEGVVGGGGGCRVDVGRQDGMGNPHSAEEPCNRASNIP